MILSNICLALETERSIVKILETLQDQFLLHNICLKEIYLQVGQIVKNGLNTLKSKMYNEFFFVLIVLNINEQFSFVFKVQDYY